MEGAERSGGAADFESLQDSILDKACKLTCNDGKRLLLQDIPLEIPKDS